EKEDIRHYCSIAGLDYPYYEEIIENAFESHNCKLFYEPRRSVKEKHRPGIFLNSPLYHFKQAAFLVSLGQ
ncbi:MAG TPA: hypothetical protein VN414_03400, partial [Methanosarcina sp.]|nr:hypothetical protein [Methanosarcina sp.]